jgi:hypothetical protein
MTPPTVDDAMAALADAEFPSASTVLPGRLFLVTSRPDAAWDAFMLGSALGVLEQAGYHAHPVAGDDGPASLTVTARKAAGDD